MVDNASLFEDNLQQLIRSLHQAKSAIESLLEDGASTMTIRQTASALLEQHLAGLSALQSELEGRIAPSNASVRRPQTNIWKTSIFFGRGGGNVQPYAEIEIGLSAKKKHLTSRIP